MVPAWLGLGQVNFDQSWSKYKDGFGRVDDEFWLGKFVQNIVIILLVLFFPSKVYRHFFINPFCQFIFVANTLLWVRIRLP